MGYLQQVAPSITDTHKKLGYTLQIYERSETPSGRKSNKWEGYNEASTELIIKDENL